jgi:NAD(P)-dependent dehydrogenase (short-subunit alcohol dehydrogenase family)
VGRQARLAGRRLERHRRRAGRRACPARRAPGAVGAQRGQIAALAIDGALLLPCDVDRRLPPGRARERLACGLGRVDLVIYLAGDYVPMRADEFRSGGRRAGRRVNFNGAMRLVATLLPDSAGQAAALPSWPASPVTAACPRHWLWAGQGGADPLRRVPASRPGAAGIGVWVINPGFVATPLTAKNDFAMPACSPLNRRHWPRSTASGGAISRSTFPKRFTRVMKLLALLPYRWYFPLIRRTPEAEMTIDELVDFYDGLAPESIARFPEFYSADAYFKDPFNEVRGVAAIQHIFSHMFRQVGAPRFIVSERVVDEHGCAAGLDLPFPGAQMGQGPGASDTRRIAPEVRCRWQGQFPPRLLGRR